MSRAVQRNPQRHDPPDLMATASALCSQPIESRGRKFVTSSPWRKDENPSLYDSRHLQTIIIRVTRSVEWYPTTIDCRIILRLVTTQAIGPETVGNRHYEAMTSAILFILVTANIIGSTQIPVIIER